MQVEAVLAELRFSNSAIEAIFTNVEIQTKEQINKSIELVEKLVKSLKTGVVDDSLGISKEQFDVLKESSDIINFLSEKLMGLEKAAAETDTSFEKIKKGIKAIKNSFDELSKAQGIAILLEGLGAITSQVNMVTSRLSDLGDVLEIELFGVINDSVEGLGNLLNTMDGIIKGETGARGEAIASGVSTLIGIITSQIEKNKQVQEEFTEAIYNSKVEMQLLYLESLQYKEANIFGAENPYSEVQAASSQYAASMKMLIDLQSEWNGLQVQTGTKKEINWQNVAKGAGAGAAIGFAATSAGGITAAVGAAVGALVGGIVGLTQRELVPVFEDLSDVYGEMFDPETLAINPQILADYDKLDDDAKKLVDNWELVVSEMENAEEAMKSALSSLTGELGDTLRETLIDAWVNDDLDNAMETFRGKALDIIADIVEKQIFAAAMQPYLDTLQEEMIASFGEGGDNDVSDDILRFMEEYPAGLENFYAGLAAAEAAFGEDFFGSAADGTDSQLSTTGAIQALTTDQGDLLAGHLGRIMSNTAVQEENTTQMLQVLIAQNDMLINIQSNTDNNSDIKKYTKKTADAVSGYGY